MAKQIQIKQARSNHRAFSFYGKGTKNMVTRNVLTKHYGAFLVMQDIASAENIIYARIVRDNANISIKMLESVYGDYVPTEFVNESEFEVTRKTYEKAYNALFHSTHTIHDLARAFTDLRNKIAKR